MNKLQTNVKAALEHLKARKGWKMRDVAQQAFFFSIEERERFYRWMMRARAGKIVERHGASAKFERALRWLIYSEQSLFDCDQNLDKFDLIDEVNKRPWENLSRSFLDLEEVAYAYLKLNLDQRQEFVRRSKLLAREVESWRNVAWFSEPVLPSVVRTDPPPVAAPPPKLNAWQNELFVEIIEDDFITPPGKAAQGHLKHLISERLPSESEGDALQIIRKEMVEKLAELFPDEAIPRGH